LEVDMTTISSSERMLKTLCGACLILAPALLLVGGLIHPEETTDASRQFEIIVDNLGRWELAHWLISAAMLLMAGAVVGLAHLLHEHRPAEGIVGGAATMTGVMGLFAVATFEAVTVPEIGRSGDAQLFETIFTGGGFMLQLSLVLLLPLGLIIMSYGMYRSRVVPAWVAGCVAVGGLLFGVALPTGSPVVFAIGLGLLFVGLARVGWSVLSESDEQWNHPPQTGAKPAG
jgi:hypothetical protein